MENVRKIENYEYLGRQLFSSSRFLAEMFTGCALYFGTWLAKVRRQNVFYNKT